jgi:signal transduction histidine kinase
VESFSPLAIDASITLASEIAPQCPLVQADGDRIHQVLGNLLTNALRHTPPGGQITVRITPAGDGVQFAVSNTGEDLTPAQAAQVFSPFWRAGETRERDRSGSGLGLAIARQLVALHGGRIWVESTPGLTTFIFELPALA